MNEITTFHKTHFICKKQTNTSLRSLLTVSRAYVYVATEDDIVIETPSCISFAQVKSFCGRLCLRSFGDYK